MSNRAIERNKISKRWSGFTLIELMIALAVVGILASIAYPSYIDSVRKSRRSDAKSALMATAQTLERCYTQFNAYNHANCPVQTGTAVASPDGYYTVTPTINNATTYALTATPSAGGPQSHDAKCTSFTLTHTSAKTAAGSLGNDCW